MPRAAKSFLSIALLVIGLTLAGCGSDEALAPAAPAKSGGAMSSGAMDKMEAGKMGNAMDKMEASKMESGTTP